MRRTTLARRGVAAVAAALLLALTGCASGEGDTADDPTPAASAGDGESSSGGDDGSDSASADESDAAAGELSEGQQLTGEEFSKLFSADAEEYKQVHMTLEGKAEGKAIAMEADIDGTDQKNPKMLMAIEADGQQVEMILVDGALYMGQPGSGQPYLKFPTSDDSQVPFGLDKKKGKEAGGWVDSKDIVSATYLGEEDIDGVTCRHFKMEGTGDMKGTELYLDPDGRLARLVGTVEGDEVTMTFSKWGEKVVIKAPKKFQDLGSLAQ